MRLPGAFRQHRQRAAQVGSLHANSSCPVMHGQDDRRGRTEGAEAAHEEPFPSVLGARPTSEKELARVLGSIGHAGHPRLVFLIDILVSSGEKYATANLP
jgi:hypothetical protein